MGEGVIAETKNFYSRVAGVRLEVMDIERLRIDVGDAQLETDAFSLATSRL
jgi:hypothetical protein